MAGDNPKNSGVSRRNFIKGTAAGAVIAASGSGLISDVQGARAPTPQAPAVCVGPGDVALINGNFLTMDARNTVASAVTIRGGRFAEIGSVGSLGPCSQTIDLHGATVIPGLIEIGRAHV